MTKELTLNLSPEEIASIAYVDLGYEILKASGNTFHYRDLLMEIGRHKGLSQEKLMDLMASIYSEINIDGRFYSLGENVWGLKRWYPTEKSEKTDKSRKRYKRKKDDDEYDALGDEDYIEDEDEGFDEDYDEDYVEDEDEDEDDDRGGRDLADEFSMEEDDLADDLDEELEDDFVDDFDAEDMDLGDELSLEQLSEEEDSESYDDEEEEEEF